MDLGHIESVFVWSCFSLRSTHLTALGPKGFPRLFSDGFYIQELACHVGMFFLRILERWRLSVPLNRKRLDLGAAWTGRRPGDFNLQ